MKTAEYFSSVEQIIRLGREEIDATTHARENHPAIAITTGQIPPQPAFNGFRQ
jgi:hypothetical protein